MHLVLCNYPAVKDTLDALYDWMSRNIGALLAMLVNIPPGVLSQDTTALQRASAALTLTASLALRFRPD